jgi:hypothetical protein
MDSAMLLRSARRRAGFTQIVWAARAKTSAPAISAYENGARQPRADVLLRLLGAAGLEPALVTSATRNDRYVDMYCDEVADLVRRDPALLERGAKELRRMRTSDNVEVWRHLVRAGPSAVIAVLTSRDPEARGLKADNPFARLGVVDEETRLELLDQARGR